MKKAIILLILLTFTRALLIAQALPKVEIQTMLGDILIEVDTRNAPITATNFLEHVTKGSYRDAVFYRTVRMDNQPNNDIKIEVIQGGLFEDADIEKIKPIEHETTETTGLKHLNGTISMARSEPGTASTEIFICVGNQPELDFGGKRNPDGQGFAAFGQVLKGMDVVRKIQQQKDEGQYLVSPVKITSVEIIP